MKKYGKAVTALSLSVLFFLLNFTVAFCATENVECADCYGQGYSIVVERTDCPLCHGEVSDTNRSECTDCGGSGSIDTEIHVECTHCSGKGYTGGISTTCTYCDGSGKTYTTELSDCTRCSGKGYKIVDTDVTCSNCDGSGAIAYSKTCSSCKGTGKHTEIVTVTCSDCNGAKTFKRTCNNSLCDGGYINYCYACGNSLSVGFDDYKCPYCASEMISERLCDTCKGKTYYYVSCAGCDGEGEVSEDRVVDCSSCSGAGTVPASVECAVCKGDGTVISSSKVTCSYCNNGTIGTSYKVDCAYCDGSGIYITDKTDCTYCSGNGYTGSTTASVSCATCGGHGYIGSTDCSVCGGVGYFQSSYKKACETCYGLGYTVKVIEEEEDDSIFGNIVKGLKFAFVPSFYPIKDLNNLIDSKVPVAPQIAKLIGNVLNIYKNYDYTNYNPEIQLDLSGYYGAGVVNVIDMSWYAPYRTTILNFISLMIWIVFLVATYRRIPSIIKGV